MEIEDVNPNSPEEKLSGNPKELIDEEVESLKATFVRELEIGETEGVINVLTVNLEPKTGDVEEDKFVKLTLVLHIPDGYPGCLPTFELRNPRGLSEDGINRIKETLVSKSTASLGSPMLFEMIESAQNYLTLWNMPSCKCVICLYDFHQDDVFTKTECFHFFHSVCLAGHIKKCRQKWTEEEKEREQNANTNHDQPNKPFKADCPVCRMPVVFNDAGDFPPPKEAETDEPFQLTSDLIKLQKEMNDLYQEQKVKGGIIDLEAEKNRFHLVISEAPAMKAVEKETTVEEVEPEETKSETQDSQAQLKSKPEEEEMKLLESSSPVEDKSHDLKKSWQEKQRKLREVVEERKMAIQKKEETATGGEETKEPKEECFLEESLLMKVQDARESSNAKTTEEKPEGQTRGYSQKRKPNRRLKHDKKAPAEGDTQVPNEENEIKQGENKDTTETTVSEPRKRKPKPRNNRKKSLTSVEKTEQQQQNGDLPEDVKVASEGVDETKEVSVERKKKPFRKNNRGRNKQKLDGEGQVSSEANTNPTKKSSITQPLNWADELDADNGSKGITTTDNRQQNRRRGDNRPRFPRRNRYRENSYKSDQNEIEKVEEQQVEERERGPKNESRRGQSRPNRGYPRRNNHYREEGFRNNNYSPPNIHRGRMFFRQRNQGGDRATEQGEKAVEREPNQQRGYGRPQNGYQRKKYNSQSRDSRPTSEERRTDVKSSSGRPYQEDKRPPINPNPTRYDQSSSADTYYNAGGYENQRNVERIESRGAVESGRRPYNRRNGNQRENNDEETHSNLYRQNRSQRGSQENRYHYQNQYGNNRSSQYANPRPRQDSSVSNGSPPRNAKPYYSQPAESFAENKCYERPPEETVPRVNNFHGDSEAVNQSQEWNLYDPKDLRPRPGDKISERRRIANFRQNQTQESSRQVTETAPVQVQKVNDSVPKNCLDVADCLRVENTYVSPEDAAWLEPDKRSAPKNVLPGVVIPPDESYTLNRFLAQESGLPAELPPPGYNETPAYPPHRPNFYGNYNYNRGNFYGRPFNNRPFRGGRGGNYNQQRYSDNYNESRTNDGERGYGHRGRGHFEGAGNRIYRGRD